MSEPVPIWLDCDVGVDDAMAILYLAGSGRAELVGVGSVHGNVPAPLAARNALRVLETAGLQDVPVAVGACRPLAQPLDTAESVHGADGLGNTRLPEPRGRPVDGTAAEHLVGAARERPGELTLLATGPCTNLALALMLEPRLPELLRRVVVMGGALRVPGNITPHAEANIGHDPEAAEAVFQAGWPVTMVGLDVTMAVRLGGGALARLEASSAPAARFASAILQHYLGFHQEWMGERACPMHDPLAAGVALDAGLVRCRATPVHVELRGERTRGATLADLRPHPEPEPAPDVAVAEAADGERFLAQFTAALTA